MPIKKIAENSSSRGSILLRGFLEDDFLHLVSKKIESFGFNLNYISYAKLAKVRFVNPRAILDQNLLFRTETLGDAFKGCEPADFDGEVISAMNEAKVYFYRTLDRVFIDPLPNRSAELFFSKLLLHFIGYLRSVKNIKVIILSCSPCFPDDTALFFAAKHLNIPIYFIRRTLLNDKIVLVNDFRASNNEIKNLTIPNAENIDKKNIYQLLETKSYWIKLSKKLASNEISARLDNPSKFKLLLADSTLIISLKSFLVTLLYRKYREGYYNINLITYLKYFFCRQVQYQQCKKWLSLHTSSPDLSIPYIYFGLHFQPERSTDPEASFYTNQIWAIKRLASNIPEDWRIYVKEHPRQISAPWDLRRLYYRNTVDYEEISKIKNVYIVPINFSSDELVRNAKIISSPTGSIVWEGLLVGRPGLTFGKTWHSNCKSSPVIDELNLIGQINLLIKKSTLDVKSDLESFLANDSKYFIDSVNNIEAAKASNQPQDMLADNLALVIANYCLQT